jgi:hypothetical protein
VSEITYVKISERNFFDDLFGESKKCFTFAAIKKEKMSVQIVNKFWWWRLQLQNKS